MKIELLSIKFKSYKIFIEETIFQNEEQSMEKIVMPDVKKTADLLWRFKFNQKRKRVKLS